MSDIQDILMDAAKEMLKRKMMAKESDPSLRDLIPPLIDGAPFEEEIAFPVRYMEATNLDLYFNKLAFYNNLALLHLHECLDDSISDERRHSSYFLSRCYHFIAHEWEEAIFGVLREFCGDMRIERYMPASSGRSLQ